MKLFLALVSLNLVLAMAVVGFLKVQRTPTGIAIYIETGMLSAWYQTLKELSAELISSTFRRHRNQSDDISSSKAWLSSRKN